MTLRAIIVGSAGQDGRLLKDLLSARGYDVIGVERSGVVKTSGNHGENRVEITNPDSVSALVSHFRPDEIYYLAAHHHSSEDNPGEEGDLFRTSTQVHVTGPVAFLEAIRRNSPRTRLFYAASCHIFGTPPGRMQDENTPINPESVYGITKAAGLFACRRYREAYNVFASVGILYNHESSLRSARFVSKKITAGVAAIKRGRLHKIVLGNLEATADWGFAPDYVAAMHTMLQLDQADDFVLATGKEHTLLEFVSTAFECVGLDYRPHVETDAALVRRNMPGLVGNPAKFEAASGWRPSLSFREMVNHLVQNELNAIDGK
jgi:GDPmannose 4,6-dehydratase